uniref:Uncharacterized protein n=1 Tax=Cryptococcus bacillisporus CA1280 TaxID=1296109 RepID=A0A0D0VQ24_CRYGA|nr:hypothetical protein I312_01430 [Cryptococcus bacillisporus CA1280]
MQEWLEFQEFKKFQAAQRAKQNSQSTPSAEEITKDLSSVKLIDSSIPNGRQSHPQPPAQASAPVETATSDGGWGEPTSVPVPASTSEDSAGGWGEPSTINSSEACPTEQNEVHSHVTPESEPEQPKKSAYVPWEGGVVYSQPIASPDPVELPPLALRSKRKKKSKKAKKAKSAAAVDGEGSAPEAADPGGWGETASVISTPSETSSTPARIHPSRLQMQGGNPKANPVPSAPSGAAGGWGESAFASTSSETSTAPAGIHPSRLRMLGGAPKAEPVPAGPTHDYSQPQSRRVSGANASGDNDWGNKRRTPSAPANDGVTHSPNAGSFTYPQPDARPAPPSESGSAGGTAGIHPDRLRMLGGAPAVNSPSMGFGGGSRDNPPRMRGRMDEFGAAADGKPRDNGWGSRSNRAPAAQAPTTNGSGGGWGNDASNSGVSGGW